MLIDTAPQASPADPALWRSLYMLGCYAMAAGCLYRGVREGARAETPRKRWMQAAGQVWLLAFLVVAYWLLESWAHHRTPFYLYSSAFSDLVPRFRFEDLGVSRGVQNACTDMVLGLAKAAGADRIPLCVLLMEASLTYSALWTARLLGANLVIQPFLAALVLVNVDALLDPVVATAHNCVDGALLARPGIGLGFWEWYVDPSDLGEWYGVPIFNFAVWFAAPLFLISLVNLLAKIFWPWALSRFRRSLRDPKQPRGAEAIALLTMAGAIAFVHWIAPKHHAMLSAGQQKAALAGLLGLAALLVFAKPARWNDDERVDTTLTRPASIALAIPALALLFEGFFVKAPQLIPVGLFAVAFALMFAFAPYRRAVRRFCDRVASLDRFVRLHYFGFTAMLVLLGAGLLRVKPEKFVVAGLLLVALCFHVWSYVSNDVVDLDLDREQPRRAKDPLVSGRVSKEGAIALAIVQIPLAALATLHLLDFRPQSNPWALVTLGAGFALIFVYNAWGKTFRLPPLADLTQALGWGSLVLFGALVANRDHPQFWARTTPLLLYVVGFILLISGVHGGLRDLWTDRSRGMRTTAQLLGARPADGAAGEQPVESSRRLAVYAFGIHSAMFLIAFSFLWRPPETPGEHFFSSATKPIAWAFIGFLFVLNHALLRLVVRRVEPRRDHWMSLHAFALLLPPLALFVLSDVPDEVFKVVVACCFFVPLLLQENILPGLIRFLYRDLHPFVPFRVREGEARAEEQEWARCCNYHDLVYWEGGILGGLLPWPTASGWEWRYLGSNLGLARCMWRLWDERVRGAKSGTERAFLATARGVLPVLFVVISTLLGWTTWSLVRRDVTAEQLAAVGALPGEGRRRLERWI